jgi:hypothetical protein
MCCTTRSVERSVRPGAVHRRGRCFRACPGLTHLLALSGEVVMILGARAHARTGNMCPHGLAYATEMALTCTGTTKNEW